MISLIVAGDEQRRRRWKIFLIVTVIAKMTQLFLFLKPYIFFGRIWKVVLRIQGMVNTIPVDNQLRNY